MARYVVGGAFGRQMKNTLRPSYSRTNQNSVTTEPASHTDLSFASSFESRADVFGKDQARHSVSHHCRRATGVRATLTMEPRMEHFATLGVGHNASKNEIKSAYRMLAKQYHPDVCQGDHCEMKFMQITTAYEQALNSITGGLNYAPSIDNYAEECGEELEEWEEWMGWEGAIARDFSADSC